MTVLIVVDVQNDFLPGGPLEVPEGDKVIPVLNRLMPHFDLVVASQDWHPPEHGSFAANHPGREPGDVIELDGLEQILWPVHCVQGTPGAELAASLDRGRIERVFRKGMDPNVDSYSAFFDNGRRHASGVHHFLESRNVDRVAIGGLATNVCVRATALDAIRLGYPTSVIADACRGVELQSGDVQRAIDEMRAAGAEFVAEP